MSLSQKKFLLTAFLLFFLCVAGAQKFSIGAKAGVLASWASFADSENTSQFSSSSKIGFSVGGLINFPLKNNYSFQAEAGFSQQGRKIAFNDGTWENKCTYYFGDFSMALRRSFKLYIGKDIPANWFINVGPSINYWIQGKGEIDTGSDPGQKYSILFDKTSDLSYDKMFLSDINRWLFGLSGGIGFNATTLRNQKIVTELRFSFAKTYLGRENSATINILGFKDNLKANLITTSLSVAYVFDKDILKSKMGKSTQDKVVKKKKRRRR